MIRIASPCPESWTQMAGNDRIRYCGRCSLNVYNLAVMSREEVEGLIRKTNGRLCGRIYLRGDRTVTLRDRKDVRRRRWFRRAVAVAVLLGLAAFSWMLRRIDEPSRSIHPPLIRRILNWIEPERQPVILMGKVGPPPSTP